MCITLCAVIFTVARVRHSNPFIIWDRGFHILSHLIPAQINCVQALSQADLKCSQGFLRSLPATRNKWYLLPWRLYHLTGTPPVTKCVHLHVLYHRLNARRDVARLKKTGFWSIQGWRGRRGKNDHFLFVSFSVGKILNKNSPSSLGLDIHISHKQACLNNVRVEKDVTPWNQKYATVEWTLIISVCWKNKYF